MLQRTLIYCWPHRGHSEVCVLAGRGCMSAPLQWMLVRCFPVCTTHGQSIPLIRWYRPRSFQQSRSALGDVFSQLSSVSLLGRGGAEAFGNSSTAMPTAA